MPLEIKELHIKATVVDKKSPTAVPTYERRRELEKLKKEIVKECVGEVLQILEDKKER
jgi:hypothetical protein